MNNTLVLLSGGIDSYVLADLAKKNSDNVYGLTFNYAQVNEKEIECAREIAKYMQFEEHIVINIDFGIWKDRYMDNILVKGADSGSESAYVPARNMIFLSYAVGIAESLNINNIAIGTTIADFRVNKNSSGGFADCSPKFLKDIQVVARDILGNRIKIYAPLVNTTKAQIIKYGIDNGLQFEKTWSCYQNKQKPCGKCMACQIRIYGFYKCNKEDSLEYEEDFFQLAHKVEAEWEKRDN